MSETKKINKLRDVFEITEIYSAGREFGDRLMIQSQLSKQKKVRPLLSPRKIKSHTKSICR